MNKINLSEVRKEIEKRTGISFENLNLLRESLTHPSFKHENSDISSDNQRLEFLGDAVINLIITELLFKEYPEASESLLTQMRIYLVKEETLAQKAKNLRLNDLVFLGVGEEKQGGREKTSILCDLFESFLGAVYLEKGYEYTKNFLKNIFREDIKEMNIEIDWKNLLQTQLYRKGKKPQYILVKEEGPEHEKKFYVELWVEDEKISIEVGKSKREAEIQAAKDGIKRLKDGLS